ncbi:MAG: calcium-binding protein [Roseovarius sp.]|nr:calcium-binding protein [Roseovarius sp.]
MGGNTVKASTEHYTVMQNVLTDQRYPEDPDAVLNLDDDLRMHDLRPDGIGGLNNGPLHDAYLLELTQSLQAAIDNAGNPDQLDVTDTDFDRDGTIDPYDILTVAAPDNPNEMVGALDLDQDGTADVIDGPLNGYGADADITDILKPNESTVLFDIAYGDDYSITLKDDGKLLYRFGNAVKRPTDVRMEAELELPEEWNAPDDEKPDLIPLYQITSAELVTHHTISNSPNDQIRPEDYENEAAIGRLPDYEVQTSPDGDYWISTQDFYAGDGTFYPAGTVLKDPTLPGQLPGTVLDEIGATGEDLEEGFTNAYYTTMDREPFEPVLTPDGTDYDDAGSGPRWRLKGPKYGQDLPGVEIPVDPTIEPPATRDEVKYERGAETQTVLNLLDWEGFSPLSLSAGWQNAAGTVTENGLNRTMNFDVAYYVKGEGKPSSLYSTELVMDYEELPIADEGDPITGGFQDDILVGEGNNTMTGGVGEDVFVVSYGKNGASNVLNSDITDFELGSDILALIGLGVTEDNFDTLISQTVVGSDLVIDLDGSTVATLEGVTTELEFGEEESDFLLLSQSALIIGTNDADTLVGDALDNDIRGLDGDDTLSGGDGDDTIEGGAGADSMDGGDGTDTLSYTSDDTGVTVRLYNGIAYGGDATGDTFSGFENLVGGSADDYLVADTTDNVIRGNDGDDYINVGRGDDTAEGGAGDDYVIGGEGADMLSGGDGIDTLSYFNDDTGVTVKLYNGVATRGDAAGDSFSGFENLEGGSANDFLTGDTTDNFIFGNGGDDYINVGGGDDTAEGGAGNDTIHAGDGTDVILFSGNRADYTITGDTSSATVEALSGDDGIDTLFGAESLQFADDLIFL